MKIASIRSVLRAIFYRLNGDFYSGMEQLLTEWVCRKRYLIPCISVTDVSREIGYTGPELNEFVKYRYGMDFRSYITKLRISDAEQILLEVKEPVCRVSEMCGFSDKGNFSRQFKKYTGYTPTQWRSVNGFK